MTPILSTRGLSRHWGGLRAVDDVSLMVEPGARHALIGPNGAGKTTLINLITGYLAPSAGEILLEGVPVTRKPQHERVKLGITRTFQVTLLFPGLTVLEAVLLAILEREGRGGDLRRSLASCRAEIDEARDLLARLRLDGEQRREIRGLAYGKQRVLEIALALASRPRVLLLDEPAAGIPSNESAEIFGVIAALPRDVTVLFIEHDMNLVFRFAERITVLASGQVLAEGTPDEVARHAGVRQVYLGEDEHV